VIKEIIDKTEYTKFLLSTTQFNFLQSWEWGEFQISIGNKAVRYGLYENDSLVGITTIFFEKTKLARIATIQGGPIFKIWSASLIHQFISEIKASLKSQIDILRVAPYVKDDNQDFINVFKQNKFQTTTGKVIADYTSELDISVAEEKLLTNMRKTTRYLIRQKEKFGITIEKSTNEDDIRTYCDIEEDTVAKHGFNPYPYKRILNEFRIFAPDHSVIIKATYKEKVISMAIIMFYGDEADYLYGASLNEYNNIPASYVVQWEAIKEAKSRGCTKYNFWGVSDQYRTKMGKQEQHPWWGLSQFKRGFGGQDVKYTHGFDYVYSLKGNAQRLLEIYRKSF
jgi:peptidoglycan pentaglycine glycine transferase (the first glycine)